MIDLKNITFAYPSQPDNYILKNVSMNFPQGEFISIIGKSGCGKSTLFKLLTTEYFANSGEILYKNRPIQLGDVAYMPQKDLLLPWLTILDNVLLSSKLDKHSQVDSEKAIEWLQKAGLNDYINAYPHQLSGGMRQRAAFVRTLLSNRDVLLLDEPFGALDAFTQYEMQQWLLSLFKEMNKTILFITHNIDEAILLSHRIYLMKPYNSLTQEQEIRLYPIDSLPDNRDLSTRYLPEFIHYKQRIEVAIHEND